VKTNPAKYEHSKSGFLKLLANLTLQEIPQGRPFKTYWLIDAQYRFNIQQLYVLPTLYLCVLYLSENKQRLVPLTA
jgi:hypothetical protein